MALISALHVVLARTIHSGNVGSVARAMANLGADRLILIDPRAPIDNCAFQMAAGAPEKIITSSTYKSWSHFLSAEPDGWRIALSRRGGRNRQPQPLAQSLADLKIQLQASAEPVDSALPLFLIFGPEDHGLTSDEAQLAHRCCYLPTYGSFQSFNLAHAVLLSLFLAREAFSPEAANLNAPNYRKAGSSIEAVDSLIREWLNAMGFDWQKRRASAFLALRRMLLQNWPSAEDLHVFTALLRQNIRLLKAEKSEHSRPRDEGDVNPFV